MMKKIFIIPVFLLLLSSCASSGGAGARGIDVSRAIQAGADLITAATISDNDIATLSFQAVAEMDKQSKIAGDNSPYVTRLKRLTKNLGQYDGIKLNFKVYETKEVNAFATGDGSIRVYSGLMDLMDDSELMAVIGHEIGHVAHADVKHAMQNAYKVSAARNAVASTGGRMAQLSGSLLSDMTAAFVGAQFSQKQELAADDYALEFCVRNGLDPYGMANALDKLVTLSNGAKASTVQNWFSSHPDSELRAKRMREKAAQYKK